MPSKNKKLKIALIIVFFVTVAFYMLLDISPANLAEEPIIENNAVQDVPENYPESSDPNELAGQAQKDLILDETRKMKDSRNSDWWVNAGGEFIFTEEIFGKTIQGELPEDNFWRKIYNRNNPENTDNGLHPQNIFRLVTRTTWKNLNQETYFRIKKLNLSETSYRNKSNGLLHFNRYQDGDNLYYVGIRVDGFAVIKKKKEGIYYTMAQNQIFEGEYDRENNPNLLPLDTWIGIRSQLENKKNGSVSIKVYVDRERNGEWELAAEAADDGKKFGGKAFSKKGYAGIRTDFMDVEFDGYEIGEMGQN